MTDDLRLKLHNFLEDVWGTGWGEAEAAAYLAILDLLADPEKTTRR